MDILRRQITGTTVFDQTYALGHMSFMIAKDMSWFSEDIVELVGNYATNDNAYLQ